MPWCVLATFVDVLPVVNKQEELLALNCLVQLTLGQIACHLPITDLI